MRLLSKENIYIFQGLKPTIFYDDQNQNRCILQGFIIYLSHTSVGFKSCSGFKSIWFKAMWFYHTALSIYVFNPIN